MQGSLCMIFGKSVKLGEASLVTGEKQMPYTRGQKRQKRTIQSHFDPWEYFEKSTLGRYFLAYKGMKVIGISMDLRVVSHA